MSNVVALFSCEIWSCVLDELDVTDIFRLSVTCHRLNDIADAYWDSHISLSRILYPYFNSIPEIESFRTLMHQTGTLISGSSALQAFARVQYHDSDLDLYVEKSRAQLVRSFLTNIGYVLLEAEKRGTKDGLDPGDGYPGKTEITTVDSFICCGSGRIVQVIGTDRDPMLAVLNFHSTCVMNIFTDSDAYSLYPFSTLCERRTLVCGPTTTKIVDALKKYEKRGWKTISTLSTDTFVVDPTTEYMVRNRRIGDSYCWSRNLKPSTRPFSETALTPMLSFKWKMKFRKFRCYGDVLEGYMKPIEWFFEGKLEVTAE